MSSRLQKFFSEPLFQFLLIGLVIYGVYGWYSSKNIIEDERVVSITSGEILALSAQFERLWNRSPTDAEFAGVLRDFTREIILYREALAMGLDKDDVVIRRRLAQKLEMMAQTMIRPVEPSPEDLQLWFDENIENYTQPDLFTMTQIFFDPDKRDAQALEDAKVLVEEFNALSEMPENISDYGDSVMMQNFYPQRTQMQLSKQFGTGFIDQVVELEEGQWFGPILSGYGVHVVYMGERVVAPLPQLADLEEQVRNDWMIEKTQELSDQFMEAVISRYEVIVEETEVPLTVPRGDAEASAE